jgi:hypothetical protein
MFNLYKNKDDRMVLGQYNKFSQEVLGEYTF